MMTNDEARQYFADSGLTYQDLLLSDIEDLNYTFLQRELDAYFASGDKHAVAMGMSIRKLRLKDVKVLKRTGLVYADLKVRGSYFESRESITFNKNGFIGFGGEFDTRNTQPILKAFCAWCDYTKEAKSG